MTVWYTINDVDQLDTPALVVFPVRVKQNIDELKNMIDDVSRLRPHIKTNKSAEATSLMLEAGIRKFKCATIAEAELLGLIKAPDALLAYQPVGPKLQRFIKVIKTYSDTYYSSLIDQLSSAAEISQSALKNQIQIPVYIDLNVGQNRTGIPVKDAMQLFEDCQQLKGIKVVGLHAYDGHIHDRNFAERKSKSDEGFIGVSELQSAIVQKGYPELNIIAGGSPTFPIHAQRKKIECSPGTFIYWDQGYSLNCPEQPFVTAALVVTRVISLPDSSKLCVDLGHKSISAENELSKRVYFINAPELIPIGHSEEHMVLDAGEGHNYKIGDILYGIPYHVCPTVALYERAVTILNNQISAEWLNIARDKKINI